MRGRAFVLVALLLVAFLGMSCAPSRSAVEPAHSAPPAPGYELNIARERAKKDEMFRVSPDSPLPETKKLSFQGLAHYPVDPSYRFAGRLELHPRAQRLTIAGTTGERRVAEKWAIFRFLKDGRIHTLQIYRLLGEPGAPEGAVFLPFADETTGRETYPAGRYVEPEIAPDGSVVVDFNRAYYPFCAYGKAYDCPITPAENRLEIPILAGERDSTPPARAAGALDPSPRH